MAERTSWTDERIDDLVAHLYARMDRFEADLRDLRAELLVMQRQFATFGWGIVAAIFVQTIVAVIAALIASA